ncbi:MAG: hypothetical protein ABIP75_15330 [Pyrinomonadaceae bacterium]
MTQSSTTTRSAVHIFIIIVALSLWVNATLGVQTSTPTLDQQVQAGFTALKAKDWKLAQASFAGAVKTFDAKPAASALIMSKLSPLDSAPVVVTKDGKPTDVAAEVNGFRKVMGTQQALYEFLAFSAQLAGDGATAQEYLAKVDEMRGVMWERSWVALIPQIHTLFYGQLTAETSENYGKYLLSAGGMLLAIDDPAGLKVIRQAKLSLPKDPAVPAQLASYLIVHDDPAGAKTEAKASLALDPNQASVLIDLATANWLLGDLEGAAVNANQAAGLRPQMPGPHATLAFVALEKGDLPTAVREAELGNKLGNGHQFFKSLWAVCLEASGDHARAVKLMNEAWPGGAPDLDQLKQWFFRRRALELARRFVKNGP